MARGDSSPNWGAKASLRRGRGRRERSHRSRCASGPGAGSLRALRRIGSRGGELGERRLGRSRVRHWPFLSTGPSCRRRMDRSRDSRRRFFFSSQAAADLWDTGSPRLSDIKILSATRRKSTRKSSALPLRLDRLHNYCVKKAGVRQFMKQTTKSKTRTNKHPNPTKTTKTPNTKEPTSHTPPK